MSGGSSREDPSGRKVVEWISDARSPFDFFRFCRQGFLHEGHLSLVRQARERADAVVCSIYVNPAQFAPGEDLAVYPRSVDTDLAKLAAAGCEAAYVPARMYRDPLPVEGAPPGKAHQTWVTVERLQRGLCGASRPTFFRGVATVVTKLFNVVEPDVTVFGEKDYQQLAVVRRLVKDLDFGIEVLAGPLVREADGLAMSSRNANLTPENRERAAVLHRTLLDVQRRVAAGATACADLVAEARRRIEAGGGRVDYVEIVDADTLEPLEAVDRAGRVAAAAWFGGPRLLDNVPLPA